MEVRKALTGAHAPLEPCERRCSYSGCEAPTESSQFIQIREETAAGGQDWSWLAGSVLCRSCYQRFLKRGTLERSSKRGREEEEGASCSHPEGCRG